MIFKKNQKIPKKTVFFLKNTFFLAKKTALKKKPFFSQPYSRYDHYPRPETESRNNLNRTLLPSINPRHRRTH